MLYGFRRILVSGAALLSASTMTLLSGCGGGGGSDTTRVSGETQQISGQNVSTWAVVDNNNTVQQVGVTVPAAVFANPPLSTGTGPAGSLITPAFPAVVQNTTLFNHLELGWQPSGHPPAYYSVPHFDFHFYGVPMSSVQAVTAPDTAVPDASRIPAGYTFPGLAATVPQMGTHASPNADFAPGAPGFTKTMIVGYYGGNLTFLEPMITQAYLNQHQSYTVAVPRPATLGRATRYPTQFSATYNASSDTYDLVFSDFVDVT